MYTSSRNMPRLSSTAQSMPSTLGSHVGSRSASYMIAATLRAAAGTSSATATDLTGVPSSSR